MCNTWKSEWRSLDLGSLYSEVVYRLFQNEQLKNYIHQTNFFKSKNPIIEYRTEILCPSDIKGRTPVVLLFSNPHPHSIIQGMFLSPNIRGNINPFWKIMQDAGMFPDLSKLLKRPQELRYFFENLEYRGKVAFFFYCFFDFPSSKPDQLKDFFRAKFYVLERNAYQNFTNFIKTTKAKHIICFGQKAYKFIADDKRVRLKNSYPEDIKKYTKSLLENGYRRSYLKEEKKLSGKKVNLYLTYPTFGGGIKLADRVKSIKSIKEQFFYKPQPS